MKKFIIVLVIQAILFIAMIVHTMVIYARDLDNTFIAFRVCYVFITMLFIGADAVWFLRKYEEKDKNGKD